MNASGKGSVVLTGSAAAPIQNIKLYGWSSQDGTPTLEKPVPIMSAGENGSIKITISNESRTESQTLTIGMGPNKNLCQENQIAFDISQSITFAKPIPAGTFTISSVVESTDTDTTYSLMLFYYSDGTTKEVNINRSTGSERKSVTTEFLKEVTKVRVYAGSSHNTSVGDTAIFTDFQIEAGSVATSYVPYNPLYINTDALRGIPVKKNGNFTDPTGQQWVCDEIDFKRGKFIQRVAKIVYPDSPAFYETTAIGRYTWPNCSPIVCKNAEYDSMATFALYYMWADKLVNGNSSMAVHMRSIYIRPSTTTTSDELNARFSEIASSGLFYTVAQLENPIETDLSPEIMEAFYALRSYYPTTVVANDANAYMWIQYLSNDDLPDGPFSNPKTEVGQYYRALSGYDRTYPAPTCRETMLIRAILDPDYILPFTVNELSSRTEWYLWDLIHNTKEMLNNIPTSDTEKFLHMMIGGEVTEYPALDCERNFWMSRCVERQLMTTALLHGGRI